MRVVRVLGLRIREISLTRGMTALVQRGRSMIDLELLNYDLQEYVCEDSNWLDHPLVRRELRSEEDIAKANEYFEMKTRGISEAVDERDWMLFVDLHERPHRLNAVLRLIEDGISVKQLWPVIGRVWCDTENVRQNFDLWRGIWSMNDTDRALVPARFVRRAARPLQRSHRQGLRT
jgi:hypothetical protein